MKYFGMEQRVVNFSEEFSYLKKKMSSNILTLSILKIIIIECVRFQMIKVFLKLCRKKDASYAQLVKSCDKRNK